ncbi:MAG: G1 family endopeptidase [Chloroflexota bacterium]|nr:G1 family endopeptidase [Chloroflexota bacterium]
MNGVADGQDWFLVIPDANAAVYGGITTRGGDDIQVEVQWNSPGYYMQVYDTTTGQLDPYGWNSTNLDGKSAEYIAERPQVNGTIPPLRNFGTWHVSAGQAGSSSATRQGLQFYPLSTVAMTNSSGTVLATPGPNSGESFQDYWQRCG